MRKKSIKNKRKKKKVKQKSQRISGKTSQHPNPAAVRIQNKLMTQQIDSTLKMVVRLIPLSSIV